MANLACRRLITSWSRVSTPRMSVRARTVMASMKLDRCVSSFSAQLKLSAYVRNLKITIPSGPLHAMKSVNELGGRFTVGDVVGRAAMKITALGALATDSGGFLEGTQSFHQGVERTRRTRASHAGTEYTQSSDRPVWQSKMANLSENSVVAAVRTFPWEKVYGRFIQRVVDLVQIVVKWLAIPVLALSALSELLYTLTAKKDIFIPLGILTGVLLAKIVGNASLDVVKELQDGRTSWPLVALGMFFVLLKLPGPYYPSWAAAFLPHVANAGLVQTAFLLRNSHLMFV